MDFKSYLTIYAAKINKELDIVFKELKKNIADLSPHLSPLVNSFCNACAGGKRIRGVLVCMGYELTGNSFKNEILNPSAAYEIFQTAILSHDDIVDKSLLRRGKKTLYQELGGDNYAVSQTIALGDMGYFFSYWLLTKSKFGEKEKNTALGFYSKSIFDTGVGQLLDVELPRHKSKDEQEIITVYTLKTAYYTFVAPLSIGAILGGADDTTLSAIRKYGTSLGIAFQIQDDINDLLADAKKLGKSTGSDIKEGKNTVVYIKGLENANQAQKKTIKRYYGNSLVKPQEIEEITNIFHETGAIKYAQEKAEKYLQDAKKYIDAVTKDEQYRKLLLDIIEFVNK